jgi:hypothetical protein
MAGRPLGATNRPQFWVYTNEKDRKAFVLWVKKHYKKDAQLAKWYGDQLFGKAVQPIGNEGGKPFLIGMES